MTIKGVEGVQGEGATRTFGAKTAKPAKSDEENLEKKSSRPEEALTESVKSQ